MRLWALHHAGERPLVEEGLVAIGWREAGDLTDLAADREEFKYHLRERYPGKSEPWIAGAAGQLLRFRHGIGVGELVVYPRKRDRTLNLGRVVGEYSYRPDLWEDYPQRREVEWMETGVPRDRFSRGVLNELGASMTLFAVRRHAGELLGAFPRSARR